MADSMIEVLAAVPDEDTPGLWIEFYTTKDRDRIMALLKPAKDDPAQWPSPKFQAELDAGVAIAEALNLPAATEAPAPAVCVLESSDTDRFCFKCNIRHDAEGYDDGIPF